MSESIEDGVTRIAKERRRQIEIGRTLDHDREHVNGELAIAGSVYAMPVDKRTYYGLTPSNWPWTPSDYHPSSTSDAGRIRELEKAGALIAAEIDRLLAKQKAAS